MDNVTCKSCGWVHFPVSKSYIKSWQKGWDEYWPTLDEQGRKAFGLPDGPPSPESYYHCFLCKESYKNFRDFKDGDCGEGNTIQPILDRNEDV